MNKELMPKYRRKLVEEREAAEAQRLEAYRLEQEAEYERLCALEEAERLAAIEESRGLPGEPGKDGIDGIDGKDGKDGIDGIDGRDGLDGKDGKDGLDGRDGIGRDGRDATATVSHVFEKPHVVMNITLIKDAHGRVEGATYTYTDGTVARVMLT